MAQTLRQQARRQVNEATATRKREFAEREARLAEAAVEVVTALVARDRAEEAAANAIADMAKEHVNLTEISDRCGLSLKEVARLKRTYLDAEPSGARPISDVAVAQEASRS
ncbi:MAG: hypothetical protein QM779_15470 [Propionicimonas sp.]|uniref:hypothetical protein n=1 Tax=Propionicimonas sp. TaxID=1955623 RepID=UPI003D12A994